MVGWTGKNRIMVRWIYKWMDGQKKEIDGLTIDVWLGGCIIKHRCIGGRKDNKQVDGWTDNKQMDGWMDIN